MTNTDLKELLDALHDKYNSPDFIADEPISVPHRYTDRADREIAGFFSATIAWGNRKAIVRSGHRSGGFRAQRLAARTGAAFVLRPPHVQRRGPARFRAGPAAYGVASRRHREFLRDAL